jgi:hypothetical protein
MFVEELLKRNLELIFSLDKKINSFGQDINNKFKTYHEEFKKILLNETRLILYILNKANYAKTHEKDNLIHFGVDCSSYKRDILKKERDMTDEQILLLENIFDSDSIERIICCGVDCASCITAIIDSAPSERDILTKEGMLCLDKYKSEVYVTKLEFQNTCNKHFEPEGSVVLLSLIWKKIELEDLKNIFFFEKSKKTTSTKGCIHCCRIESDPKSHEFIVE